jgi:hypothetical protein
MDYSSEAEAEMKAEGEAAMAELKAEAEMKAEAYHNKRWAMLRDSWIYEQIPFDATSKLLYHSAASSVWFFCISIYTSMTSLATTN